MKIINLVLTVLLICFAGVQYNDPDAFMWMMIYLSTAFLTGATLFDKYHSTITQLLMFILSINLMLLITEFSASVSNIAVDSNVTYAANLKSEVVNEIGGLIVCLLILTFVFWQSKRTATSRLQRI